MPELSLVLTQKFTEADAQAIQAALNRHLRVSNPVRRYRQSIDPSSVVLLLGAAAAWQILVKPAAAFTTAFFSALGTRAGYAAWDRAAVWKKDKDLTPLADVATTLAAATDSVGDAVTISVASRNHADDTFGEWDLDQVTRPKSNTSHA